MNVAKRLDHESIMNGQTSGPIAAATRWALAAASVAYRGGVTIRNRRYDRGRDVHRVDVPVLCVGNLTTGGTGKTPVVAEIARRLRSKNVRVAIVSRGYGRGESGTNDEAKELYDRLPDVPHVQDADRVAAATIAVDELESQFVVMDDGFGHRRLHRDANVVLIDATNPFGFDHLLPRGLLREPLSSLARADLVILTRTDQADGPTLSKIEQRIAEHFAGPILRSTHAPTGWRTDGGDVQPIDTLQNQTVALVSAIGNPAAFERTAEPLVGGIGEHFKLPDHAAIDAATMTQLQRWANDQTADAIVCTHKDLVKLRIDRLGGRPLYALQIDLALDDPDAHLSALIDRLIPAD